MNEIILNKKNLKDIWKDFYINPKNIENNVLTAWIKYRKTKKAKILKINKKDVSFSFTEGNLIIEDIGKLVSLLQKAFNIEIVLPLSKEELTEYNNVKNDKRIISTYDFIKKDFIKLNKEIEVEQGRVFNPDTGKNITNEETYYREIGKIYKFSYIQKRFKELIYFYKKDEKGRINPFPISLQEKEKIKNLLILCNMGIVLKVLEGIVPIKERNEIEVGVFIAEGMQAVVESIDKFEIGFTAEKATKNTKIKFLKVTEEGFIKAEIIGNKPFANIDIEIEDTEEETIEKINIELEWVEQKDDLFKAEVLLEELENEYQEGQKIKLSVSKKVGHPSTFLTTNVFFALKNFLSKRETLKVSDNYYILQKQISKIGEEYDEKFHKTPSDRWLAFYLLTQRGEIKRVNEEIYEIYQKKINKEILTDKEISKLEIIKDLDIFLRKERNEYLYLTENKNKKRLLMLKTKEAKSKNKNGYGVMKKNITGLEDEHLYLPEFEKLLFKKEKNIKKVKILCSGVTSLDQEIESQEGKTVGDFLGTTESIDTLMDSFVSDFRKENFVEKMKQILTPKEYFYLGLYFFKKMNLEDIAILGFYSNGTTEARKILKSAISKIIFYTKYKSRILEH